MGEEHPSGRLVRTPKEGERILAPTRRPDGTLRKPIRIRAGYVPQDEVAIYQSKGALLRKGVQADYPPGYDPVLDAKPKSKSAKRNERKKEKRLQAAISSSADKGKNLDSEQAEKVPPAETVHRLDCVELVTEQINNLSVSGSLGVPSSSTNQIETPKPGDSGPDIDKKIRALKKKIRLAEAQLKGDEQTLKPEHLDKITKVEGWRDEIKFLEDRKAELVS